MSLNNNSEYTKQLQKQARKAVLTHKLPFGAVLDRATLFDQALLYRY